MGRSVVETADLTETQPLMPVCVCGTGANTKCVARTKEKAVINTGISSKAKCWLPATVTFLSPQPSCSFPGAHFKQDPLRRSELCIIWEHICVRQYICSMLATITGDRTWWSDGHSSFFVVKNSWPVKVVW